MAEGRNRILVALGFSQLRLCSLQVTGQLQIGYTLTAAAAAAAITDEEDEMMKYMNREADRIQ